MAALFSKVIVVDDDPSLCSWVKRLVQEVGLDAECHHSAHALLESLEEPQHPTCLVLDIKIPGMNGIELQKQLLDRGLDVPIIMLTGHADVSLAVEAMKRGAFDFVEKPCGAKEFLDRIKNALREHERRLDRRREKESVQELLDQLTPRESEILGHIVEGKASKKIAFQLGLSQKTVEVHRSNIMRKLRVSGVVDLVRVVVGHYETA